MVQKLSGYCVDMTWISMSHLLLWILLLGINSEGFTLYLMPEPTQKTISYTEDDHWPPDKSLSEVLLDIQPPDKTLSELLMGIQDKTLSKVWVGYSAFQSLPEESFGRIWQQSSNKVATSWQPADSLAEPWTPYTQTSLPGFLPFKRNTLSQSWSNLKEKRFSQAWYEERDLLPDPKRQQRSSRLSKALIDSETNRLSRSGYKEKRFMEGQTDYRSSEDVRDMFWNYMQQFMPEGQSTSRRRTNIVLENKNAVCTKFDCSERVCCSGVCTNVYGNNMCVAYAK